MREIELTLITDEVEKLLVSANHILPQSTENIIKEACECENTEISKSIMNTICNNIRVAKEKNIPICQDTGMAVLFFEIGQEVHFTGGSFEEAVNAGVHNAYVNGYLRKSVVIDPLFNRVNTNDNTPAIIHTQLVSGDTVKITAAPKGFGSENMSKIKMFNPSQTKEDIIDFVVETVLTAGSNPCPPIVIGVGIGGTFEKCTYLAKKALVRSLDKRNQNENYAQLEKEILEKVNQTGIGPQGFGGKTTALACNVEYYPTHIAGLPVAVNINCHVCRHKEVII